MNFKLEIVTNRELEQFKKDMQEAFQKGFEDVYGPTEGIILPEKDIVQSLNTPGAIAYKAIVDNEMVGGAIVVIKEETQHNDLHLLYVKHGIQTKGIGKMIWDEIERLHPETIVWETCTPCFEKNDKLNLEKLQYELCRLTKGLVNRKIKKLTKITQNWAVFF